MTGVCAYCLKGLDHDSAPRCPTCDSRHHLDCWRSNGGCAVFGCAAGPDPAAASGALAAQAGWPPPGQAAQPYAQPYPQQPYGAHAAPPAPSSGPGQFYSPREKRLDSDYRQLMAAFAGHANVRVEPRGGYPPERYGITLKVPGLRLDEQNRITRVELHFVELYLPAGYPREKPYATSTYPVFHPNFGAHICIADYWSPAQSLVDIVIQIANMLQYREYNIHSPLNAVAANWVADNKSQVPVGEVDLMPGELDVRITKEDL